MIKETGQGLLQKNLKQRLHFKYKEREDLYTMEDFRFKVNLGGMIEILSDHLYSSPDVYIRELLQNGVDAISAREKWEEVQENQDGQENKINGGIITLEIEEGKKLSFTDNGLGLTEDEIHRFLAIIGESSKRDMVNGRIQTDYIGRFGIGLLSCFMVSGEIRMFTKSCKNDSSPLLEWRGRPDGIYNIISYGQDYGAGCKEGCLLDGGYGTQVILDAKPGCENYFTRETIKRLVIYYGMLLPFPVVIRQDGKEEQINPVYLPWEGRETNRNELMLFGSMMFAGPENMENGNTGMQFFDCLPFKSEEGKVSGAAYILNYPVQPTAKNGHRIYLKNMLLTEKGDNLIPDWAVFAKFIVNATDLRPTASREGFYVDEVLGKARDAIEDSLIEYISDLAETNQEAFDRFFSIHHMSLMPLALASPKLFKIIADYCEFVTTRGMRTGYMLRTSGEPLVYAPTEAKYKQLSQLFFAQDKQLINVSYVYSYDILVRLGEVYGITVTAVEDWDIEELMKDLTPEDQDDSFDFARAADHILKNYDCRAEIKYFSPANQPTFYLMNEKVLFKRQITAARSKADEMFYNMLDAFADDIGDDTAAVLYFNYDNPLVKKLVEQEDEKYLKLLVEILYIQALQIGGFPLQHNELGILNRNILMLMEKGLQV